MLIYHLQVGSQSKNYLVSDTEDDKWNTGVETKAQVKKKRMKQKSISSVTITKPIHTIDRSHNFCLCSSFSSHNVKNVQIQSFSCIWTEYWDLRSKYGDLRSKYLYLVQNQENKVQKKSNIWTLSKQCWGGLASPHSNNSHQTSQSMSTTEPANRNALAVEKQNIGEELLNH